ncbi:unnamed protein product, partial [Polarella glacialis]
VAFDLNRGLALFNGNCAHSVNDFEGSRYSVVYFTLGCHAKMPQKARDELKSLGVFGPAPGADRYTLLRPPHGITGKKGAFESDEEWLASIQVFAPHQLGSQQGGQAGEEGRCQQRDEEAACFREVLIQCLVYRAAPLLSVAGEMR